MGVFWKMHAILTVYLKWSMWQCIETESVSCVCGAGSGSGSDGPEHTAAVAEAETDDVDPAEVVSQCEAGSDLTPEQKNSISKNICRI